MYWSLATWFIVVTQDVGLLGRGSEVTTIFAAQMSTWITSFSFTKLGDSCATKTESKDAAEDAVSAALTTTTTTTAGSVHTTPHGTAGLTS